jgi:small subunit ribosomal protein S24e
VDIEILEEKENPLLRRKELRIKVSHNGATPRRAEVREKIIALKDANRDSVVLHSLHSRFGARESIAFVKIYESPQAMLSVEQEHVLRKNFSEEELEALRRGEELPAKEAKEEKGE